MMAGWNSEWTWVDTRERLVADLVGAGLGLRRLEDAQDELEEIFMDLARGGAA